MRNIAFMEDLRPIVMPLNNMILQIAGNFYYKTIFLFKSLKIKYFRNSNNLHFLISLEIFVV